jgi:hypothetical protein
MFCAVSGGLTKSTTPLFLTNNYKTKYGTTFPKLKQCLLMFSSSPGAVYEVKNNDVQGIRGEETGKLMETLPDILRARLSLCDMHEEKLRNSSALVRCIMRDAVHPQTQVNGNC